MKKHDKPRIQGFPIDDIAHRITYEAMNAAHKELQNWDDKINEHLRASGKGLVLSSHMKFHLKFTIKPIKSNVKQESRGEKSRTAQGSKESSPKKIGTKSRKAKFTRSSPNPLD